MMRARSEAAGAAIGALEYADDDKGDTHTFKLADAPDDGDDDGGGGGGGGGGGASKFTFADSLSNRLTVKAALDYEAHPTPFALVATVTDKVGHASETRFPY